MYITNKTQYPIIKGQAALQSHFHVIFTVANHKSQTFCARKGSEDLSAEYSDARILLCDSPETLIFYASHLLHPICGKALLLQISQISMKWFGQTWKSHSFGQEITSDIFFRMHTKNCGLHCSFPLLVYWRTALQMQLKKNSNIHIEGKVIFKEPQTGAAPWTRWSLTKVC